MHKFLFLGASVGLIAFACGAPNQVKRGEAGNTGGTLATGGNLILSGNGGTPSGNYFVLTTTNVTLPVANWSRIATNQFDATGLFNLTNQINPATPQLFYRLQLP